MSSKQVSHSDPQKSSDETLAAKLRDMAEWMDIALTQHTGLRELDRKKVIYHSLATHAASYVDNFPILDIVGKTNTGKTSTSIVHGAYAYLPESFSVRQMTVPALRNKLGDCHNRTAIIEEADSGWKGSQWLESLLSDRTQRQSAKAALQESMGEGQWKTTESVLFGPTVMCRRTPFADAALDRRTIFVRTRPDHKREYEKLPPGEHWKGLWCLKPGEEYQKLVIMHLPEVDPMPGVTGGIFDLYYPLLAVAELVGDTTFREEIAAEMLGRTARLKEDQADDPDGLVLQALVGIVLGEGGEQRFGNVKCSDICKALWGNWRYQISPRQVAGLARDLGFDTRISHGMTVIVVTPGTLLRVCGEWGYEDEAVDSYQKEFFKRKSGREGREGRDGGKRGAGSHPPSIGNPFTSSIYPHDAMHETASLSPKSTRMPERKASLRPTSRRGKQVLGAHGQPVSLRPSTFAEEETFSMAYRNLVT